MLLPVVCDLSVMVAVVTVSDSDVSVVNEDRIGESAAVIPVSDSDESVVDEDGIGKNLSKEDWNRLLENDWLTDRLVYTWKCNQIGILFPAAHATYIQIILNYLELLKAHLEANRVVANLFQSPTRS